MSSPTSGDLLLVSRGGVNYQIDYNDMSTLQDTDLLLVSRDGVNYKIEAQDLGLAPRTIESPVEVLTPLDGAGDPDLIYLKTDTITAVDNSSGTLVFTTDAASAVDDTDPDAVLLTFPSNNNFEYFPVGYVLARNENWNHEEVWSNYLTAPGGFRYGYYATYAFDNNPSSAARASVTTDTVTLDLSSFSLTGDVVVTVGNTYGSGTNPGYTIIVYDADGNSDTWTGGATYGTHNTTPLSVPGVIDRITVAFVSGAYMNIYKYVIDGKELVSNGINDPLRKEVVAVNSVSNQLTIDGGTWSVSDFLSRTMAYDTTLTFAGSTDLALMSLGSAVMTDGVLGGTGYSQTSYNLTTSQISNIGTYNIYTVALSGSNLNSGQSISSMFDGNLGTYFAFYDGGPLHNLTGSFTITFTEPIENVTSLKLATAWASSTSKTVSIQINGYNATVTNLWNGTGNIPLVTPIMNSGSIPTQITSITIFAGYNPATLSGIEVNGNLLIYPPQPETKFTFNSPNKDLKYFQVGDDLGTQQLWDQSKTWSTLISSIYQDHVGNTNAFDGVVDRTSYVGTSASVSQRWIQCNTAMAVNGRVRVMTQTTTGNETAEVSVTNGTSTTITAVPWAIDADGFIDCGVYSGTLNYVRVYKNGAISLPATIAAIEVNNKLLVDTGVSGTSTANIIVSAVDTNANTLTVSNYPSPYSDGDVITLATNGGVGDIVNIDASTNKIYLTSTGGFLDRWIADNNAGTAFALAAGSVNNPPAPTAAGATFTSSNAGTTAYSGTGSTLASRTWTLETASSKTGPWTLVNTYTDTDPVSSQDGATAWTTNRPTLSADTWYRVKVAYNAAGADSVESEYHTFKTAV